MPGSTSTFTSIFGFVWLTHVLASELIASVTSSRVSWDPPFLHHETPCFHECDHWFHDFAFEIPEPCPIIELWRNSICICGVNLDLFSPQEKLSDSIMAVFHKPSLELMNLKPKGHCLWKVFKRKSWSLVKVHLPFPLSIHSCKALT